MTARPPHCPRPRGRGPPVPPAPPAGPNSPHPEPRGERGAETDGEGGVAAMQLRCVRGTGQSWRQLRDRPRPSSPGAERPNGRAGPDARAKPRPLSPLFWRPGFPSPFFFSYDPSVLGTVARPGSVSLSNAFSPEPTPSAAGKHTHERSHSRPARAHGRRTRAARLVHERARPTASARPGAARQLSAPRFHSNPLPTTLFLHFCVKAVHIPGHPLHTFDCVLATVRRHSKNKQTKKPPALEKQQNF